MTDAIDDFWKWWRGAADGLAEAFDSGVGLSEAQIAAVAARVRAIGDLAWETGPGKGSRHHFALSAEGDAKLRVLTQRWFARAPAPCAAWEFFPARQASGSDSRQALTYGGKTFTYGDFRLSLARDDVRERFDITVYHPTFAELEDDACYHPTLLMLDDVLGEDGVVSWVGAIELSREPLADGELPRSLEAALGQVRQEWNAERTWLLESKTETGAPHLILVKPGIKRLDHLLHDHHYQLTLEVVDVTDEGLPDPEENDELNEFEEQLMEHLGFSAVWIGHESFEGKRVIHFHGDSSSALQEQVENFCTVDGRWEGELSVRYDPAWEILARY